MHLSLEGRLGLFLEAHPGFAAEVWRMEPGKYLIRGRQVTGLPRGMALQRHRAHGQSVLVADVDGWMRSVAEIFEDLWREFVLERRANSGASARRLLARLLAETAEKQGEPLLRQCFGAWSSRASIAASAPRSRGPKLLRRAFSAWLLRHQSQATRRSGNLRAVVRAIQDPFNSRGVVLAAWRSGVWIDSNTRALDSLSSLRRAIPTSLLQVRLVGDEAMRYICFLQWSREVERSKRHAGDAFMLGQAGHIRHDIAVVERTSLAAETMRFDADAGPEMRLTQLSSVLDTMLTNLELKHRVPHLTSAARLVASPKRRRGGGPAPSFGLLGGGSSGGGSAEFQGQIAVDEAVKAFETLEYTRQVARRLQTDVAYVLQLRCLSAWVREVVEMRSARGQEAFAGQVRSFEERMVVSTRTLVARLSKHRLGKGLRDGFDEWQAQTSLARALRAVEGNALKRANEQYEQSLTAFRIVTFAAARSYSLRLVGEHLGICIRSVWQRWVGQAAITRMGASVDVALRRAEVQLQATALSGERLRKMAGDLGTRFSRQFSMRGGFQIWRGISKQIAMRTRQNAMVRRRLWLEDSELLSLVFIALMRRHGSSRAKRFAVCRGRKASDYTFGPGAIVVVSACFLAFVSMLHQKHNDLDLRARQDRARLVDLRSKLRVATAVQHAEGAFHEGLLRLCVGRWGSSARHEHDVGRAEVANRQLRTAEVQGKMLRERARVWQLRAGGRFGDAYSMPLLWTAVMTWAQCTREASLKQKTASEWLQRQRRQDAEGHLVAFQVTCKHQLQRMTMNIVQAHTSRALPRILDGWRFRALSLRSARILVEFRTTTERRFLLKEYLRLWETCLIRIDLRAAAGHVGEAVAVEGDACVARRVFLAWFGAVAVRLGERKVEKFVALLSIVPVISRGPAKALQHWRKQTEQFQMALLDGRSLLQRADAANRINKLLKHEMFDAWKRWYKLGQSVIKLRTSFVRRSLLIWHLSVFAAQQDRHRERAEKNGAIRHSERALHHAAEERGKRAKAQRRFARWYWVPEAESATVPKCFAAWVLAALDAKTELQADGIAKRAMHLGARYRTAAERFLSKNVLRAEHRVLLLECWIEFVAACRHRLEHRTFKHQLRTSLGIPAERLCARIVAADAAINSGRCFQAWAAYMHELHFDQRHAFHAQATGLATRLVTLNSGTYGFATVVAALHAWRRSLTGRATRLSEHLVQRGVRRGPLQLALWAWRLGVAFQRRPAGYNVSVQDRERATELFLELALVRVQIHGVRRLAFAEAVMQLRFCRLLMAYGAWSQWLLPAEATRRSGATGGTSFGADGAVGSTAARYGSRGGSGLGRGSARAASVSEREPSLRALGLRALAERLKCILVQGVIIDWRRRCLVERSMRVAPQDVMQDVLFALICLRAWRSAASGGLGSGSLAAVGRRRLNEIGLHTASYIERAAFVRLRGPAGGHLEE